ncbi:MAG TPA: YdeI/OmpD-associated family protein [Terracidiphilus sp.]|jgi:uncharacterized protein YdeI (YjbR/CyaY-like superfamily)
MSARNENPKVDAYIEKSQSFAQPILAHLRKAIHAGCPLVEETIKWSMPFFEYRGTILCNMSAFKEHCRFGFWGLEISAILRKDGLVREGGASTLGRITSVESLPPEKKIVDWVSQAAALIESGQERSPVAARTRAVKPAKPAPKTPPDFDRALGRNKKAAVAFAAFSPSCRREYVEWIVDAKRPETRVQRIATAVDWIAQGKQRNWKYQK